MKKITLYETGYVSAIYEDEVLVVQGPDVDADTVIDYLLSKLGDSVQYKNIYVNLPYEKLENRRFKLPNYEQELDELI